MQVQISTQKQSLISISDCQSETLKPTSSALISQLLSESAVRLPVDAIYFISLKKANVRRAKLLQHLLHLGISDSYGAEPIWHIANDGNRVGHKVDNSIKIAKRRPKMSISEIGCCASHREVWTKIVQNGHQSALVLEDDARFNLDKLRQLVTNWNRLPEFDFLHLGWEHYPGYYKQKIKKVEIDGLPDLWKGDGMWLTHAYIIKIDCALDWLTRTQVQTNGLDAMTSEMQSHCKAYGFKPAIAYQEVRSSGLIRSQIHHTG